MLLLDVILLNRFDLTFFSIANFLALLLLRVLLLFLLFQNNFLALLVQHSQTLELLPREVLDVLGGEHVELREVRNVDHLHQLRKFQQVQFRELLLKAEEVLDVDLHLELRVLEHV